MLLDNLLDVDELKFDIARKYISVQSHPQFPELKIYNYADPKTLYRPNNGFDYKSFWSHTVSTCRGLIVDTDTNEVVSRPFRKFHNYGFPFPDEDGVDYDWNYSDLEFLNKLDGWFGVEWRHKGEVGIASRGSFISDGAKFATDKFQKFKKYGVLEEFLPKDWTLLFEIIFKKGQIIIPYNYEGIVLIGAKNKETGEEMRHEELTVLHKNLNSAANGKQWVRLVEKVDIDLEQALDIQEKGVEGFVVNRHIKGKEPLKAKIKFDDYLKLQKMFCRTSVQEIWHKMAYPIHEYQDASVPIEFRRWARSNYDNLLQDFYKKLSRIVYISESLQNKLYNLTPYEISQEAFPEDVKYVFMYLCKDWFNLNRTIWDDIRPEGKNPYRTDIDEDVIEG